MNIFEKREKAGMLKVSELIDVLSSAKIVALDSMVFIYHWEENQEFVELTDEIFRFIEKGKVQAVTSNISELEVLSSPILIGQPKTIEIYKRFFNGEKNFTTVVSDEKVVLQAANLRRQFGLRLPDSIQLASALVFEADLFITNDKIFQKMGTSKLGIKMLSLT